MSTVLEPHARIADRYELLRRIGEGGMGSVWQARHIALDAPVAIKFVHAQIKGSSTPAELERFHVRFEREAKLAASIRHRNVVSITDYGRLSDGTAYMVMDYLEGQELSDYLASRPPVGEVLHLIEQATRGLVAAHDAGIVHRDLKPENIFLVRDATGVYPMLIDFGISRNLRPEGERRSAVTTQEGAIIGTPAYMSPEQARGLAELDERTDVYSMGVILYEALSGTLPYDSPYVGDLILAVVMGGAKPLHQLRPDLDPRLCNVVMKAMAREPTDRYANARELLHALVRVTVGEGGMLRSDRPPQGLQARERLGPAVPAFAAHAGEASSALELPSRELGLGATRDSSALEGATLVHVPGLRRSRRPLWIFAALALVGVAAGALWSRSEASGAKEAARAASASAQAGGEQPHADQALEPEPAREAAPDAGALLEVTAAQAPSAPAPAEPAPEAAPRPAPKPERPAPRPRRPRGAPGVLTELDY